LYAGTGVPVLAHWVFQFAFADCASTICSGTMIGRTDFIGDILYSVGVSGFIYPIIGHWAWGPDGFLANMGQKRNAQRLHHFLPNFGMNFHDFAGSTVVHSIGGWIALAGGIMLGPRIGRKFKRDGGAPMLPHDLTVGVIGGFLLWFGWYGFNPGSSLSAMDYGGIGRISANTTLAACTGGWRRNSSCTSAPRSGTAPSSPTASSPVWWPSPAPATGSARRARAPGRGRRGRRGPRHRSARIPANRRSDRRVARACSVRHVGHAVPGLLRLRPILRRRQQPRTASP
jgi:hypothetical protein